jgi:hypothetical protein
MRDAGEDKAAAVGDRGARVLVVGAADIDGVLEAHFSRRQVGL